MLLSAHVVAERRRDNTYCNGCPQSAQRLPEPWHRPPEIFAQSLNLWNPRTVVNQAQNWRFVSVLRGAVSNLLCVYVFEA